MHPFNFAPQIVELCAPFKLRPTDPHKAAAAIRALGELAPVAEEVLVTHVSNIMSNLLLLASGGGAAAADASGELAEAATSAAGSVAGAVPEVGCFKLFG